MKSYIALLRGINVSGQKKIKMADLKLMVQNLGMQEVQTYIQSGNVVFKSAGKTITVLETIIKKGILETFGFDVPVLVKASSDLQSILEQSPYQDPADIEAKKVYFVLLKSRPEPAFIEAFSKERYLHEDFVIANDCVYLRCNKGAGQAKLSNNVIERKLKVRATTRNYNTMVKLIALSS